MPKQMADVYVTAKGLAGAPTAQLAVRRAEGRSA